MIDWRCERNPKSVGARGFISPSVARLLAVMVVPKMRELEYNCQTIKTVLSIMRKACLSFHVIRLSAT